MRLKLRELALRLSKPWTKRSRASLPLQGISTAWLREGKTGPILTCLTSPTAFGRASDELGCNSLLPGQERRKRQSTRLPVRLQQGDNAQDRKSEPLDLTRAADGFC